ncbi:MAG TPA: hypothetical protein VG942_03740 [Hyphomonadaceae bacterium]|nr:hypothetical protein [Hyphomonadaceae bacterium]
MTHSKESSFRRGAAGLLAALFSAGLAGCVTSNTGAEQGIAPSPERQIADGRLFASLRCGSCHALDRDEFSPNRNAPPMKELLPRLDFKLMERDRVRGVTLKHGEMPPLDLSLSDKDDLVAYLKSISGPAKP